MTKRCKVCMTLTQLIIQATNMNNPWTNAYNHPSFAGYNKEQIDEMLICELQEIYNYE